MCRGKRTSCGHSADSSLDWQHLPPPSIISKFLDSIATVCCFVDGVGECSVIFTHPSKASSFWIGEVRGSEMMMSFGSFGFARERLHQICSESALSERIGRMGAR